MIVNKREKCGGEQIPHIKFLDFFCYSYAGKQFPRIKFLNFFCYRKLIQVSKVIVHEQFSTNDIALLKLGGFF